MGIVRTENRPGHFVGVDTSTEISFVPTVFEVRSATPDFLQIYSNTAKVVPGSRAVAASDELVAAYYASGYQPLKGSIIVDIGFRDERAQREFWKTARTAIEAEYPQYFRHILNPESRNSRATFSRWRGRK